MPGYLTTHVLDTAQGRPAARIDITLFRLSGEARHQIATARTNADGRTDTPILPQDAFATGTYELVFHCTDYLRNSGTAGDPLFLSDAPLRLGMAEDAPSHVPLPLPPYGYSTYRGS